MITINNVSQKLNDYNIKSYIIEDCELIDFRYLSRKISNFYPYCLYIFKASNLPTEIISQDKINFLIIKDDKLPTYLLNEQNQYNYIVLDNKSLPIYNLIYIIQDIFNINTSLLSFQEDILNAIGNSNSIDEIIKITFNYIKKPIILLNSMYHTCSYYKGEIIIDDPSWIHQLKFKKPHPTYSLLYNQNIKNRKLGGNKEEIIKTFFPEIMKYKEVTVPIRHNNFIIARISVLEHGDELTNSDLEILKTLSKLIYPIILKDKRFISQNNNEFNFIMTYLLTNSNPNKVFIKNELSSLNIKDSNNKYLLVLKDRDNINSITKLNYIKQYFSSLFNKHIIFNYKNSIIVVFNNKNTYEKFYKSSEYKEFLKAVNDYTLIVGISKLFNNFEDMKNAYEQCIKAIYLGDLLNKDKNHIYYFDDYVIFNMILCVLEKEDLNNVLDIKLKNLILSNNQDLYYSLYTYINCQGDAKLTSEKLNIHYNTLKYRLNKIETLFNMNLSDEDYLSKLKFSFIALDCKKLGGVINVHDYE